MTNPRLYALKILQDVTEKGRSLDVLLSDSADAPPVEKDRALAKALAYGVLRHYFQLRELAGLLLRQPLKRKDQDLLLLIMLGLFQLRHHRTPEYAVVSESVNVTAMLGKPWARGLLNGLLRNYLRHRDELNRQLRSDSARFSAPQWVIDRLRRDWPEYWQDLLLANSRQAPMTLRINLARIARDAYLEQLVAAGLEAGVVEGHPAAIQLNEACEVDRLPGFSDGLASVQDAAAQWAIPVLDPQPGDRVLDACAAPGGKTGHLLEYQPALSGLWVVEADSIRAEKINHNMRRLGFELRANNLKIADAADLDAWWDGQYFDRILLDAPCSASGVIRRHPDIQLLRREEDIDALCATQARLLRSLWRALAPGGSLLYCTCSVFKEENESQIQQFLEAIPEAEVEPVDIPGMIPCAVGSQILSGSMERDGFYYARLIKRM